ncbi:MAG: hypothetical protein PHQ57_02795 [Candidatus Omnitrophica bacterium]|nr:hypothetical protein [Candidatus Omnitrophota bacterium]
MSNRRAIKTFLATIILLFFGIGLDYVYPFEDGFLPANRIEGRHFVIYYSPQSDLFSLVKQLNISSSDRVLAGESIKSDEVSADAELADMVETLFLEACNILDMNLYNFKGDIKICRNQEQINSIYSKLFDKEASNWHSFYSYNFNTIYISADSFKREILGREIARAVISHYFVVLPSDKVQEVLATYVEYRLRKSLSQ